MATSTVVAQLGDDPVPKRRDFIPFIGDRDNASRAEWRARQSPRVSYTFPKGFVPRQHGSFSKAVDSQNRFAGSCMFPEIEVIEAETGTTTVCFWRVDQLVIQIWGENAENAKVMLREFVEANARQKPQDSRGSEWAKINSLTKEQRVALHRSLEDQAAKDDFRRQPPENATEVFTAQAFVDWPMTEFEEERREQLLGRSFEALDPIRMMHHCYIRPTNSGFEVLSKSSKNTQAACQEIRKTYFQCISHRKIVVEADQLLKPFTNLNNGMIELNPVDGGKTHIRPIWIPTPSTKNKAKDMKMSSDQSERKMQDLIEKKVKTVLETMQWYKGALRFRARLGHFIIKNHHWKPKGTMSVNELSEFISEMTVDSCVTDSVGDKNIEDLVFTRLGSAQSVLTQTDLYSHKFANIRPVYACSFLVRRSERYLRLDSTYAPDAHDKYVRKSSVWLRCDDEGQISKMLDINLIDVTDSISWNLNLEAGMSISDAAMPDLRRFAETIQVKANVLLNAREKDDIFFDYPMVPGLQILSLTQKASKFYNVLGSAYICEATKTQLFTQQDANLKMPFHHNMTSSNPQWSVEIFHKDWTQTMAENTDLTVGARSTWTADISRFFSDKAASSTRRSALPDELASECVDGIGAFIDHLDRVKNVVIGKKASRHKSHTVQSASAGKQNVAQPKPAEQLEDKLQPGQILECWYWANGDCNLGSKCLFEHRATGQSAPENNKLPKSCVTCRYWFENWCNVSPEKCENSHYMTCYLGPTYHHREYAKLPQMHPKIEDEVQSEYGEVFG